MHANAAKEKETRQEGIEKERVSTSLNGLLKKAKAMSIVVTNTVKQL